MDVVRGMRVFRVLVETGSFVTAARALEITTASVSKQVTRLEAHFGTQLLHRTTRQLALTDSGRLYLAHCERVLADLEDLEQALGDLQDAPRGRLRLSAPVSFGVLRLAPQLALFGRRFPEIELDVRFDDRKLDLVQEGFDLALRIGERLDDSAMTVRKLAQGRRVLCAAPGYLRAHGTPKVPSDLGRHLCLRYANHATPSVWELKGPSETARVQVSGPMLLDNSLAIRELALHGAGIALLPDFIAAEDVQARRLRPVLERYQPAGYGVFALAPASRIAMPKTRALIAFLAESLR